MGELLPKNFSHLSGFCLLAIVSLACSLPLTPLRRSVEETLARMTETGFSKSPRLLEIQLPLKVASKEDLVAWAKYVMGLMASKINITLTTVKDSDEGTNGIMKPMDMSRLPLEAARSKPVPTIQISGTRPSKISVEPTFDGRKINFEVSSIRDINGGSPFEVIGGVTAAEWTKDSDTRSHLKYQSPMMTREGQYFPAQYSQFAKKPSQDLNKIQSRETDGPVPPSNMYLPLPVKTSESARFINDMFTAGHVSESVAGNVSRSSPVSSSPDSISATRKSAKYNQELSNVTLINGTDPSGHTSATIKPILTLPFEAVITITRTEKPESSSSVLEKGDYESIPVRDPPDEFPPYFDKNFTITNESGQVNVVLEDVDAVAEVNVENESSKRNGNSKKDRLKNSKSGRRQSSALAGLIKMLGSRRKSEENNLPTGLEPPASRPATAIKSQRVQLIEQLDDIGQDKRNETSQAQEFEDDGDYDDENGGMGGSIQSLIELLPLVAPILEDLSDPASDTDFAELLQAAVPILEGLLEGDGDGPAPDIPAILVPILLNIVRGRDGEGSDANALLGPIIQLAAPFIGPIIGPLIGPLSQQSSNAPGEGGGSNLGTLVQAFVGPLSMPTGPGKMSPFSNIIAGVVSSLSKELVNGKDGLDIKSLVSMIVSGTIWGTTAALSAPKDTAYAPTSYGGDRGGSYGGNDGYGYGVPASSLNPFVLIGSSIKDILTSVLKVSSTLIQALSSILGASSGPKPYGPPPNYGPPASNQAQQNFPTTTRAPKSQRYRASRKPTAG